MSSPSIFALTGFVAWALLLLVLMEGIRSYLLIRGKTTVSALTPDNANLSPFMQRLARAHANCIEGLPIFGGLLLIAFVTGHGTLTDSLAYVFLAARIFQSLVHLASSSTPAASVRFSAFVVQMAIGAYWAFNLLVMALA